MLQLSELGGAWPDLAYISRILTNHCPSSHDTYCPSRMIPHQRFMHRILNQEHRPALLHESTKVARCRRQAERLLVLDYGQAVGGRYRLQREQRCQHVGLKPLEAAGRGRGSCGRIGCRRRCRCGRRRWRGATLAGAGRTSTLLPLCASPRRCPRSHFWQQQTRPDSQSSFDELFLQRLKGNKRWNAYPFSHSCSLSAAKSLSAAACISPPKA